MKIHFIIYPHGPSFRSGYQHQIVALAEGLTELGHSISGSENYWQISAAEPNFLIKKVNSSDLNEFDVVCFPSTHYDYQREGLLPKQLFSPNRNFTTIFIDDSDGFLTPGYMRQIREVDIVLKSHYNIFQDNPANFIPWAFGLSNRICEHAAQIAFWSRNKHILSNSRVNHGLRKSFEEIADEYFYPIYTKNNKTDSLSDSPTSDNDQLMWRQTGRRHYPSYFKRLGESLCCNAVGGYQVMRYVGGGKSIVNRISRRLDLRLQFLPSYVVQFDSWRFWESLISGCCTLHVDLEKYGCRLPVMPINGEHYLGLDLSCPEKTVAILDDYERLEKISSCGHEWSLRHYSPRATAMRLLSILIKMSS
jgi:hypothetical protein